MNTILPVKNNGKPAYDIVITDSFEGLKEALAALDVTSRKICLVTDDTVEKLYAKQVMEILSPCCSEVFLYRFPAGEASKNLGRVSEMYRFFIEHGMQRGDLLAALGGGVTGDMAGFAAATYLRGIRFIQIPTTLLAQVDASIGGKTGVDLDAYKNMVGAFHMPSLVYINIQTLQTLTEEQFACGMGEVLKHGLIRDAAYYEWTIEHMDEIRERDKVTLEEMVKRSCEIKRSVVEKDPMERGERALLNFGHTIGHAIEKLSGFTITHGSAVARGMIIAAKVAKVYGFTDFTETITDVVRNYGFETACPYSADELYSVILSDKKRSAGDITLVLPREIGKCTLEKMPATQVLELMKKAGL